MDTLQLYESPLIEATKGEGSKNSGSELTFEEKLLFELDPAQELSFDLSSYISNSPANITVLSSDSTVASHQHALGVKTEVTSPVQTDFVAFGQGTTSYPTPPTTTYMPEYEFGSASDDSQSMWDVPVKAEDPAYVPCGQNTNLTPLTKVASPTVSSSSQASSPSPARPSGRTSRKRAIPKGSEEYIEKRARNNVAVRKSRAKAKEKQKQTEVRVSSLVGENERLQKKVDLLTKELNVLKGLFINVGAALPPNFAKLLES